jgi:hypothetical protein
MRHPAFFSGARTRMEAMSMKRSVMGLCISLALNSWGQDRTPSRIEVKEPAPRVVITAPPERVVRHAASLSSALQPSAKAWTEQQAKIEAARTVPDVDALRAAIQQRFSTSLSRGKTGQTAVSGVTENQVDIEAMVLIVLMEATQDNQSDLQSVMEQMQKENEQKQELRQLIDEINKAEAGLSANQKSETCRSALCSSLPARVAALNALSGSTGKSVRLQAQANPSYKQLTALKAQANNALDSMNDVSETQSLELQMAMDRRSKLLEMMSNIEKAVSDTDSSIVQNLK